MVYGRSGRDQTGHWCAGRHECQRPFSESSEDSHPFLIAPLKVSLPRRCLRDTRRHQWALSRYAPPPSIYMSLLALTSTCNRTSFTLRPTMVFNSVSCIVIFSLCLRAGSLDTRSSSSLNSLRLLVFWIIWKAGALNYNNMALMTLRGVPVQRIQQGG